ncbi:hypothetical protein NKR19_g6190 [Coniochaeta hoffmannii]|uniref:Uncharacterized protein n=1 Tax=Coniochaeta hoffmannii TaxID=91930 RepID=A0AA38RG68_9PEZI|nr:hypothetical protein NKR19_g6190 [Coniochaeta hoffmannii]
MAPVLPRIRDSPLDVVHHSSPPLRPSPPSSSPPLSLRFASAPDPLLTPTRTLATGLTRVLPRQGAAAHTTSTVPAAYGSPNGPDAGTVVGITLGSVAGFVLLLYLIYTCLNVGNPDAFTDAESTVMSIGTASVGTRTRVRKHRHHRSPRRETVEIRTGSGRPVVVEERGGSRVREVVVEDTTRRSVSRARPPPRVVDEDEEIVVLEEHSPPRRHKSRRRSSAERRSGGYRVVAEDDVVIREVGRGSGSRRR